MSEELRQSVADSLEVDQRLLPHMPFLLQDLWALGGSVEPILACVAALDLTPESTAVLDLGCGKGAVSIRLAARLGFRVVGVDATEAFLAEAESRAAQAEVAPRCRFIREDLRRYVAEDRAFDIVVLAALGGVLGSLAETVGALRTQVRGGGYILIDDGYLKEARSSERAGYGHYRSHEESCRQLTSFADTVVEEVDTSALSESLDADYLALIEPRGRELAAKHPELREDIQAYIELQREECEVLRTEIVGALWVLQKRPTLP